MKNDITHFDEKRNDSGERNKCHA